MTESPEPQHFRKCERMHAAASINGWVAPSLSVSRVRAEVDARACFAAHAESGGGGKYHKSGERP